MIVFEPTHTELLGDALGRLVVGMDDRDRIRRTHHVACVVAARGSGPGGVALTLCCTDDVVTDLERGWIFWSWLCTPTGLLSDEIPCEVVKGNPERAFTAASCAAKHHATPSWQRK